MATDGLHLHDQLSDAAFAARADAQLGGNPHKRRRTTYLTSQHDDGDPVYGGVPLLHHDARGYTAYSQAGPDPSYFLMHDTTALSHGGQQHHFQHASHHHQQSQQQQQQQQQQQPLYYHNDSPLEPSMPSTYQNYSHEPAILSEPSSATEPWDPQLFDAGLQLKVQNLPVLDNLATQILDNLSHSDLQEVLETTSQPDSASGQAYSALVALFNETKKYYTREQIFLNPQVLNLDPSANATVRKANIATFAVAIFAARDVPFSQLDENCLDVFLPDGQRLTKSVAGLLLELKTQAYMSALGNGAGSQKELMEYFPTDTQNRLVRRRHGTPTLDPVEQDLSFKINVRRQQLIQEQYNAAQLGRMYSTWKWLDLLKVLHSCVREATQPVSVPTSAISAPDYSAMLFPTDHQGASIHSVHTTPPQEAAFPMYPDQRGAAPKRTLSNKSMSHTPIGGRERSNSGSGGVGVGGGGDKPPMTLQYEKARATTTSKSAPPSRRVSVASQRKPWSQDEEKALMDGLDRVKGPHWSQILALYGVGGRISDVLRERTQVQLKDKARNLKLFFLKSGIEVPTYLQGVTGELKTRAPAQAAKREREEKLRLEREKAEREQLEGGQRPP